MQKSSWNEPYSSSSFTKQSWSKMALYRWIRTESRWKLISLSSPDWSASLRPSFERKTRPDALIGPNNSTATGWKMWWAWMFEYFAVLRVAASVPLLLLDQLHGQLLLLLLQHAESCLILHWQMMNVCVTFKYFIFPRFNRLTFLTFNFLFNVFTRL